MELWQIIVGLLVVVAIGATLGWLYSRRQHSQELQGRFGPEYEQTLERAGDRNAAEHELDERKKRVESMDLRPLSAQQRDEYVASWKRVQAEFVDDPSGATSKADRLVEDVMGARGYPTGSDFDQRGRDVRERAVDPRAAMGPWERGVDRGSAHDAASVSVLLRPSALALTRVHIGVDSRDFEKPIRLRDFAAP